MAWNHELYLHIIEVGSLWLVHVTKLIESQPISNQEDSISFYHCFRRVRHWELGYLSVYNFHKNVYIILNLVVFLGFTVLSVIIF